MDVLSASRKRKKAAAETPAVARYDRLFDKREATDPFFMIGVRCTAPVKYSRCKLCTGRPHCPPDFWFGDERK